jgi:DNA end-binding protein Ku
VPLKTVRTIEIEKFVDADRGEFGARFVKQAYYLEPEAIGRKAFYLLKSVLQESELQAICKIVLKDREALAAIDPYSKTMLLSTLFWPDEVRDLNDLDLPDEEYEFKAAEKQMAQQLVSAMAGDFDAAEYHDEYREALLKVIQAKVDGQPVETPEPVAEVSKVTDLMAVLEASVAAARQAREAVDAKAASGGGSGASKEPTSVAEARATRTRAKSKAAAESKPAAATRTERKRKTA